LAQQTECEKCARAPPEPENYRAKFEELFQIAHPKGYP
jgi:hypothetical protein